MNGVTLRLISGIVLIVHGIGHAQGVFAALGLFNSDRWHGRSWLLTDALGESATRAIGLVIWLLGTIGFILTGLSLMGWLVPHAWWRPLAIILAIVSSVGLFAYWHSLAMFFNKAGAIAVNAVVLIGLLILNWPTEVNLGF